MVSIFCLSGNLKFAYAQNFAGPITRALGGAGLAAGESEGHILNPSTLVHVRDYRVDYFVSHAELEEKGTVGDWAINVVDGSEENLFRGGFAYVKTDRKMGSEKKEEDLILSLGGFAFSNFAIGLQGQRWLGRAEGLPDEEIFQLTFGGLFTPIENLGLAFVARNFLENHNTLLRPELTIGALYLYEENLRLRLDVSYPTTDNPGRRGMISLGAESLIWFGFRSRFGGHWDDVAKTTYATAGLGWEAPHLAIGYAFEKNTRTSDEVRQSFDLSLLF